MEDRTNFPKATIEDEPRRRDYRNIIIGVLAAALVGIGGYLIYEKNQSGNTIGQQQTQISKITEEKSEVQRNFDASLARLDSLGTVNTGLQSQLSEKNDEIAKAKEEIRGILNKRNATASELSRAKVP